MPPLKRASLKTQHTLPCATHRILLGLALGHLGQRIPPHNLSLVLGQALALIYSSSATSGFTVATAILSLKCWTKVREFLLSSLRSL